MLRGCVIGLGYMGRHHIRNLVRLMDEDVGIVVVGASDIDSSKEDIARKYRIPFYKNYIEMIDRLDPDFATIAVPTEAHVEVATELASRGIHFLIEKPVAASLESAYLILDVVRRSGVKVMVGHIERFNPAVIKLKELLGKGVLGDVISVSTTRVGLPRLLDIDVVDDLAIHDIDLVMHLTGRRVEKAFGAGSKKLDYSIGWDHADIILLLEGGILGRVTVGRLSPIKIRVLRMLCSERYVEADFIKQGVFMYRGILNKKYVGSWSDFKEFLKLFRSKRVSVEVDREEPLYLELKAFVDYLVRGDSSPVPIEDAIEVMRVIRSIKYFNNPT